MNLLERALLEKAGREHGWENVVESVDTHIVLASARHRGRATVTAAADGGSGWLIAFPAGHLTRELERSLPGLVRNAERFSASSIDTLAALLRRAAELAQSLPDQAVRTFRERAAGTLARGTIQGTEIERLVRQRVGQDVFREALMDYWGGACAVTGLTLPEVLRASHAKPWADCISDEERLDVFNGFLLVAHLDALFDRGLITFDAHGGLVVSNRVSAAHQVQLHLTHGLHLRWVSPEHDPYLQWHREHQFEQPTGRRGSAS